MLNPTVKTSFHVDVFCEADDLETNQPCGWQGNILCNANIEVEFDGCFNFEWVCPQCHATVEENREGEELPEFMRQFFV